MAGKTAVVLLNLGGPLKEGDIRPFLFNFFMDKNIITAPRPVRYLLAKWISWSRGRTAAKTAYGHLGGKSPLLENTEAQARALEKELAQGDSGIKVFVSMRHWHPLSDEIAREVKNFAPDKIILLPLYPQYSTTTSLSALEDWQRAAKEAGIQVPIHSVCCYPVNSGFIEASADRIAQKMKEAPSGTRILFSAHGLPEKIVNGGDPYQYQCEQTAAAIVEKMNIPAPDCQMCYQSRVGRLKWIGPSTDEALEKAARDKVGVIVYPLAFVSEHVETLVEIDIEYRHRAKTLGIPYFAKAETAGTHPKFIAGLKDVVLSAGQEKKKTCPKKFKKCFCEVNKCPSSL